MPQVIKTMVLAALVACVAAGCGSDSGGASSSASGGGVPPGFKRLDGPGYTLAYPASWQPLDVAGSQGAQGPKGAGGLAPQAAVGRGKVTAPLNLAVDGLKADNRVRRAGYKVVRDAPYHLDGAKGAHLVEATYNEVTGAKTTPVRTIDVLAQTDDGVALDLFLRAPTADFDRSGLRKVLTTFRLKP
jgi:hypothetical protein